MNKTISEHGKSCPATTLLSARYVQNEASPVPTVVPASPQYTTVESDTDHTPIRQSITRTDEKCLPALSCPAIKELSIQLLTLDFRSLYDKLALHYKRTPNAEGNGPRERMPLIGVQHERSHVSIRHPPVTRSASTLEKRTNKPVLMFGTHADAHDEAPDRSIDQTFCPPKRPCCTIHTRYMQQPQTRH